MSHLSIIPILSLLVLLLGLHTQLINGIGANWGTQATHRLPPSTIVNMLKDNGIRKLKLFDADATILNALSGSGIQVMVGIPNDMLYTLATAPSVADAWVQINVSVHLPAVDIRFVAVGNEPFLLTNNGTFLNTTFPALQNVQAALVRAGYGDRIKVTIPLNADVYQSSTPQPSTGDFRSDIHGLMVEIVDFLSTNAAPFTVNIYPFISLFEDPNFPVDFAFFDGYSAPIQDNGLTYTNVFDANHDTLIWALQKNGYGNMTVIVGEIGWPTDGDRNANPVNAQRFNQGFMSHVNKGTPMRPGVMDVYLFSLIDEDAKSIQPGNFERHWGIFNYDGTPKYNLRLGSNSGGLVPARNVQYLPKQWCVLSSSADLEDSQVQPSVSYACGNGDCTSLGYGTSCGSLDARGNISYAFNSYYQIKNQLQSACQFPNLSVVTTTDPSVGTCKFNIMIRTGNRGSEGFLLEPLSPPIQLILFLLILV